MIQPIGYREFREPSASEMADANDVIVESYIAGPDKYDLSAYLAEVVLERLHKQAIEKRVVPFVAWETLVYKAATEMAAKWDASEWTNFRNRRIE